MNLQRNYKIIPLTIAIMVIVLIGCRKPAPGNTSTQMAYVGLHLHTYIGDSIISPGVDPSVGVTNVYDQEWHDAAGRYEFLTMANVYISNVAFYSSTKKQWYTMPGSLLMKRIENEEFNIDSVPADTYDSVRFTVGLGPDYDSKAPSSYSTNPSSGADTVLSTNESFMYGGSSNGYYFMNIAGNVDTSALHNGTGLIPFAYGLGAPGDTLQVTIPPTATNSFQILPNLPGAQLVHIIFDYGKLLQSIPITTPTNIAAPNGNWMPVWNNVPGMFRFECSSPNQDC